MSKRFNTVNGKHCSNELFKDLEDYAESFNTVNGKHCSNFMSDTPKWAKDGEGFNTVNGKHCSNVRDLPMDTSTAA